MAYRCKLVTADGAYRYVNWATRPDRIETMCVPTLSVNMTITDPSQLIELVKRTYQLWNHEGNTWVYREVI